MFEAILSPGEASSFLKFFRQLEVSKRCRVNKYLAENAGKKKMFRIRLKPWTLCGDVWLELLRASFTDGLLHHRGWHEKFSETPA